VGFVAMTIVQCKGSPIVDAVRHCLDVYHPNMGTSPISPITYAQDRDCVVCLWCLIEFRGGPTVEVDAPPPKPADCPCGIRRTMCEYHREA
jgi:hypothetical protein